MAPELSAPRPVPGVPVATAPGPFPARFARGVLAVHAHPDDETLSTGALLATSAARGLPTAVVTCTRGERGEVLALPGTTSQGLERLEGDGPALAAYRTRELASALADLGGGSPTAITHHFLDELAPTPVDLSGAGEPRALGGPDSAGDVFEDSGMVWVAPGVAGPDPSVTAGFANRPLDDGAGRLAGLIRRLRPAVVVTYEAGGGYGHPDHVRAHEVTVRAAALAADPAWAVDDPETPGPWATEVWVRVAACSVLRRERAALAARGDAVTLAGTAGLTLASDDEDLPSMARDDDDLAAAQRARRVLEVPVEPVLTAVVAAMRAHATQIQHADFVTAPPQHTADVVGWYALSNDVLAPIGRAETYLAVDDLRAQATSLGSAP